jgi:hypothetical protein
LRRAIGLVHVVGDQHDRQQFLQRDSATFVALIASPGRTISSGQRRAA